MILLDGKKVSKEIIANLKERRKKINDNVKLAIIWVGNNPASEIYINNKKKQCAKINVLCEVYHLDEDTKENEVLELIEKLNNDNTVTGILVQSPLPNGIDETKCFNTIDPKKDIDGFSNISVGNLYLGSPNLVSCTPKGIVRLLEYYDIDLEGKNVCLINRSNIVGKPLFHLLISKNATVTMCHSKTRNLKDITKNADIIISAVGKPKFITTDMVKDGAIVVDVGISRIDGHVVGDVDYDEVSKKASYITPVPGGVGPMTIAMILENILIAKEENNG